MKPSKSTHKCSFTTAEHSPSHVCTSCQYSQDTSCTDGHSTSHLFIQRLSVRYKQTNKNVRCGNRKGLLGRNDQTHHRMGPKTMESIPPSKRNTQADIQLRTRQTNHQQETDGCIQIKHNPEHQPSRMSSKSTAYVPPKTASTPTKANTQTCSYLDFNQFLTRARAGAGGRSPVWIHSTQGESTRHLLHLLLRMLATSLRCLLQQQ